MNQCSQWTCVCSVIPIIKSILSISVLLLYLIKLAFPFSHLKEFPIVGFFRQYSLKVQHLPGFIFAIPQECQTQSEGKRVMESIVYSYESFFIFHSAKSLFSCFAFSYCSPGISSFISVYSSVNVFKRVRHSIKCFIFIPRRVHLILLAILLYFNFYFNDTCSQL